jgi:hypothetical protein
MAFSYKVQHRFTSFEKDLYLPPFTIYAYDFFFGELRICADEWNPILTVFLVPDTDYFSRDTHSALFDLYVYG